jgi:NAD(P)-dependent dehydrogenase (short-subunit alcohol dehydrogenase family)
MSTRIAFVTGGNRGLGRAAVEALAGSGADVVFTFRSHEDEAEQVVKAVTALGRNAAAIRLDTGDSSQFPEFVEAFRAVLQGWGRDSFDVLVNNAGFSGNTVLGSTDEEMIDSLYAVHYKGPYLLTQALATAPEDETPLLADNGRVINVSTGLARFVTVPYAVYASMKGAIEVLTRYWATELGVRGITVNTIAPGPVATDFAGGYLRASEQAQEMMSGLTALGRIAHAEDIGPAIAALASEDTAWITAQRIEASGGFRL